MIALIHQLPTGGVGMLRNFTKFDITNNPVRAIFSTECGGQILYPIRSRKRTIAAELVCNSKYLALLQGIFETAGEVPVDYVYRHTHSRWMYRPEDVEHGVFLVQMFLFRSLAAPEYKKCPCGVTYADGHRGRYDDGGSGMYQVRLTLEEV